jgi:hypothetical protein
MARIHTDALVASARSRARHSDGVTLVAAYGEEKPDQLEQLLSDLAARCRSKIRLAGWIRRYESAQVHATVVGLEGTRCGDSVVQENLRARLGDAGPAPPVNFGAMLEFFASSVSEVPVVVGGFCENDVNPFDPGRAPFQRSFDIRSDGLIVAMGWPHTNAAFTPYLIGLRKYLEAFNLVHKYHVRPQDQDNDLFFVVGEIDAGRWKTASDGERTAAQETINELVTECRQDLSERRFTFSFGPRDLYVVRYRRTSLAEVSFASRVTEIDVRTLFGLYVEPA